MTPSGFQWQLGKIHNASVPAVTAQIVSLPHVNALNRTWISTQSAEHAFRVVNREFHHSKPFADRIPLLSNINAVHRTGTRTRVTSNARRQIEPMKAAIAWLHRHRPLWIFEDVSERSAAGKPVVFFPTIPAIRGEKITQRHDHSLYYCDRCNPNVVKPTDEALQVTFPQVAVQTSRHPLSEGLPAACAPHYNRPNPDPTRIIGRRRWLARGTHTSSPRAKK